MLYVAMSQHVFSRRTLVIERGFHLPEASGAAAHDFSLTDELGVEF